MVCRIVGIEVPVYPMATRDRDRRAESRHQDGLNIGHITNACVGEYSLRMNSGFLSVGGQQEGLAERIFFNEPIGCEIAAAIGGHDEGSVPGGENDCDSDLNLTGTAVVR